MADDRNIKYINKEFGDLKNDLVEYAKTYFPDTYNDFSEPSPGSMFIEMAAYVGDVLSFYQDTQLQETFVQYAKEPGNLYNLAYLMGYRPKVTTPSHVKIEVTQTVDTTPQLTPNWTQALFISEFSTLQASSTGNIPFLLLDSIDFSKSSSYQPSPEGINIDPSGNPTEFLLRREVNAISGEVLSIDFTFENAEKFPTVTIDDTDIVGVLDVVDSDGNNWYEVPYLGQEYIFNNFTSSLDSNINRELTVSKTKKRFVTRFTPTGVLTLQFGAGIQGEERDNVLVPSPENIGLRNLGRLSSDDVFIDTTNFMQTSTYGIAPSNTTLTVRYLKGGGVRSNVPANTINQQLNVNVIGNTEKINTLTFNNLTPASGGKGADTIVELRENSRRAFNEQGRVVTLQDIAVRSIALPTKYGTIAKAYPTPRKTTSNTSVIFNNSMDVDLYVLGQDNLGHLTYAGDITKQNLKSYLSQYIILGSTINILDAFIINIGINFEIITQPGYLGRDVILKCKEVLQTYFNIGNWSINQPINLSLLYPLLDKVKGVQALKNIYIENKTGSITFNNQTLNYSEFSYDVKGATRNNIVYPSYDPCIFEIKYPDIDIKGRTVSI